MTIDVLMLIAVAYGVVVLFLFFITLGEKP